MRKDRVRTTVHIAGLSLARRHLGWTIALAGMAALVVAALLFDWNWFRPMVEARLSASLGRTVTIDHSLIAAAKRAAPVATLQAGEPNPREQKAVVPRAPPDQPQ